MPSCFMVHCANHNKKTGLCNIAFHQFPCEKELQDQWLLLCGRNKPVAIGDIRKNARICSEHFSQINYIRDLQHELLNLPLRRRLQKGAIPDVNLPPFTNIMTKNEPTDEMEIQESIDDKCTGSPKNAGKKSGIHIIRLSPIKDENVSNSSDSACDIADENSNAQTSVASNSSDSICKLADGNSNIFGNTFISRETSGSSSLTSDLSRKDTIARLSAELQNSLLTEKLKKSEKHISNLDFQIKNRDYELLHLQKTIESLKMSQRVIEKDWLVKKLAMEERIKKLRNRVRLQVIPKSVKLKIGREFLIERLSNIFTKGQIRCFLNDQRQTHWCEEDISQALTLYSLSKKAYHFLREGVGVPLPARSTLEKRISSGYPISKETCPNDKDLFSSNTDMSTNDKYMFPSNTDMSPNDKI